MNMLIIKRVKNIVGRKKLGFTLKNSIQYSHLSDEEIRKGYNLYY